VNRDEAFQEYKETLNRLEEELEEEYEEKRAKAKDLLQEQLAALREERIAIRAKRREGDPRCLK